MIKMHYWNRHNFEGLKAIGEKYSQLEHYELFGQYCLQKKQGLKKQAISSINEFVTMSESYSLQVQRDIAQELSSLDFYNGHIHQLLSHPLAVFLKDVLQQWVCDEPDNSTAYKWLGYISGDFDCYKRALELDPTDDICISEVARFHLKNVDFQTHHLSDSHLIGEIDNAQRSLQSAQSLIERLGDESLKSNIEESLQYYAKLLDCWQEYSALKTDQPFADWCATKGEQFNFWSIIYYS